MQRRLGAVLAEGRQSGHAAEQVGAKRPIVGLLGGLDPVVEVDQGAVVLAHVG
jgi:hypothetical protein